MLIQERFHSAGGAKGSRASTTRAPASAPVTTSPCCRSDRTCPPEPAVRRAEARQRGRREERGERREERGERRGQDIGTGERGEKIGEKGGKRGRGERRGRKGGGGGSEDLEGGAGEEVDGGVEEEFWGVAPARCRQVEHR
eukprot:1453168-Rhodomonas_salina.1